MADLQLARNGTVFQSTPPAEARGDDLDDPAVTAMMKAISQVSIHSPRRSEGRLPCCDPGRETGTQSRFNPLPPPKRGETWDQCGLIGMTSNGFQSTPPAEARGDLRLGLNSHGRGVAGVSIHSPAEARGDLGEIRPHFCVASNGFQSTPPPKRGETHHTARYSTVAAPNRVSIHSPRRSEGRPLAWAAMISCTNWSFNPLPPPKRGETLPGCGNGTWTAFQSTPPAEARGDSPSRLSRLGGAISVSFNPLPPPKRGETVSKNPGRTRTRYMHRRVSIHSPRRSEGRR